MSRKIVAYQRLKLDDEIDATALCAEAILRGDGRIAGMNLGIDAKSLFTMMDAEDYLDNVHGAYEFKAYKHDFFKCANASAFTWMHEGAVIKFMSAIRDYFNKSSAEVVYILFR